MQWDTHHVRGMAWAWLLVVPLFLACALLPPTGAVALPAPERRPEGPGERITRDAQGQIIAIREYWVDDQGRETRHGVEAQYWADGSPKAHREFTHGTPSGKWETFWQDGTLRSEHAIVAGQATPMTYFHPSGLVASKGDAIAGQRVGPWQYRFASGSIAEKGDYEKGYREGLWQYYEEDGTLREEARYLAGKRVVK
ncbi:MAG: hypothetical protein GY930_22275 [bacterium]|nr:hypothetical protein [bacterium]